MPPQDEKKDFRVAVGAEPADRPISPLRADLKISPQLFYGQLCFVLKDPVTLRYFRLQPVEHFVTTQLDGQRTARDLLGLLQQQFPQSTLTVQDILRFVGMLHESHLLVGQGSGHADWLASRASSTRKRKLLELASNFLFLKLPLFNPDTLLNAMEATLGRFIFNKYTGLAAILLILSALATILGLTDRLAATPYSLLSAQNLVVLYLVFIFTKVFHEFGHGWTTKHFGKQRGGGGEVSNMGVMLFVFTPSFYCDTSDAWMIPSRAARLWINAGGVVVELVLAALATFVWAYTPQDSLINQVALNVMISCSVATLFFNANPLMRYDGYYFLADWLEIPNLSTKGRDFLTYFLKKNILGLKPTMPPDRQRLVPLTIYALASSVYRWLVIFGIISLLYLFFDKYGLGPIGVFIATAYVLMTILMPVYKAIQFMWKQRWDLGRRLLYIGSAAAATLAVLIAVGLMPWNHTIREPLVVLSQHDEPIFVRTPGYVETVEAEVGQHVSAGQVLVRLKDPSLQTLLDRATAMHDQKLIAVTTARELSQPAAVAAAQSAVEAYDKQIALIRQRMDDLVLRSPIDGTVIRENSLQRITGNYVAPGTKLCRVIQTDKLQARLTLPQQTAALVKTGMNVKIRLWSQPEKPLATTVTRVSSAITDSLLHPALASTVKGDVQVTADAKGDMKTLGKRSTVIIDLPPANFFLADGMTGRAEIIVSKTNVAGRLWRAILDSTTIDWHL